MRWTVFEGEFAEKYPEHMKRFWGFLEGRPDLVTLSLAGSNVRLSDLEPRVVLHRSAPAAVRADPENVPDDRAPYCAPES